MSLPIILIPGKLEFFTYEAGYRHFSDMLARYDNRSAVSMKDEEELSALIKRHPRAAVKIGVGIAAFQVRMKKYSAKAFHILRKDGSFEDFSFYKAIRGK